MGWQRSESTTIPGPIVAGPEVKSMILEPVVTRQDSRSPRATEMAVPVHLGGRVAEEESNVEWISSIAEVMENSHSENGNRKSCLGVCP